MRQGHYCSGAPSSPSRGLARAQHASGWRFSGRRQLRRAGRRRLGVHSPFSRLGGGFSSGGSPDRHPETRRIARARVGRRLRRKGGDCSRTEWRWKIHARSPMHRGRRTTAIRRDGWLVSRLACQLDRARLSAILLLEKGSDEHLAPVGALEGITGLLSQAYRPAFGEVTPSELLARGSALALHPGVHRLRFRKEPAAGAFVKRWILERA